MKIRWRPALTGCLKMWAHHGDWMFRVMHMGGSLVAIAHNTQCPLTGERKDGFTSISDACFWLQDYAAKLPRPTLGPEGTLAAARRPGKSMAALRKERWHRATVAHDRLSVAERRHTADVVRTARRASC
jgi:hypothetical protein